MPKATKPAKRQENPLYPVHHSIASGRILPRPQCMDRVRIPYEIRAALSKVSLDIFTDMSNSNRSFQDALLAIYLSGLAHGADIASERAMPPIPDDLMIREMPQALGQEANIDSVEAS